jgi:DNA replication factor GINS
MDIARLRDVQSRERTTDSLQELPDSFYEDVASYIAELKAERERAADEADDPFADPDVNRLTDEIGTAEQVAESIYERRVGKIVKQASFSAAGMGGDDEGLTAEEKDLYDDLVGRIEENKSRVLDVLAGERTVGTGTEEGTAEAESESVDAAALMGEGTEDPVSTPERPEPEDSEREPTPPERSADATDGGTAPDSEPGTEPEPRADEPEPVPGADPEPEPPADDPEDGGGDERETVRITEDVGEIFGVDERTYTLESEDVVSLPEVNAGALVKQDAATRLE